MTMRHIRSNTGRSRAPRARRGFSLIELLVTMAVIAIVIAIIVPTLGGARNTAKAAATQSQLTEIGSAAQQYYTDKQRLPGYFSPRQMGDPANEMRGFTGMQNIMLDLAGGIVGATGTDVIEVGPTTGDTVLVNTTLIGTREAGGGYYTPDDKRFLAQEGVGEGELLGITEHQQLPSVADPFGTPILAWQLDKTAIQPLATLADFSQPDTSSGPARFYWASNAGFLKTQQLGKRGKNPVLATAAPSREHSLIGDGVPEDPQLLNHIAILLGSPTIPNEFPEVPSGARGNLVFHSAGIDAMYMGSKDRGGRASQLEFWKSFWSDTAGGTRLTDSDGKVESIDLLDQFDDQIESVGN
jgi:prepilin-type N-terminal cleavage/methylation domain-containing protein